MNSTSTNRSRFVILNFCFCAYAVGIVLWAAPADGQVAGSTTYPHYAFVTQGEVYVRSGPGNRHYPTGRLAAGAAVEVFRQDAGGWYAIRPTAEQFSLVSSNHVRMIDDQTAEVVTENAIARVGSILGPQRSAVQVMLKRGEMLSVLPSSGRQDGWTRIAPPAGEFRWVAAEHLSLQPPLELVSPSTATTTASLAAGTPWQSPHQVAVASETPTSSMPTSSDLLSSLPTLPTSALAQPGVANALHVPPALDTLRRDDVEIVAGSPAEFQLAQHQTSREPLQAPPLVGTTSLGNSRTFPTSPARMNAVASEHATVPVASASGPHRTSDSGPPRVRFRPQAITPPANARVGELQVRLSREVVQPPKKWNLVALREETAVLLANEQEAAAREQYREMLNRIAVFEQVQQRYHSPIATTTAPRGIATAPTTSQATSLSAPAAAESNTIDVNAIELPELGIEAEQLLAENSNEPQIPTADPASTAGATASSEAIRARVLADLGGSTAPNRPAIQSLAPTLDPQDPFENAPVAQSQKYDAMGTLKPVVSRREGAPRYALVDARGEVVSFVTASPDVDLARYVGRRIGVTGKRGFMPSYRRSHVTASRVNMLGTTRR